MIEPVADLLPPLKGNVINDYSIPCEHPMKPEQLVLCVSLGQFPALRQVVVNLVVDTLPQPNPHIIGGFQFGRPTLQSVSVFRAFPHLPPAAYGKRKLKDW